MIKISPYEAIAKGVKALYMEKIIKDLKYDVIL